MQNDMKGIKNIFFSFVVIALASCSGTVDTSSLPELKVSDVEIDLTNETHATFTVTYAGVDVTDEAEILTSRIDSDELKGNVFTPIVTGSADFYAIYDGKQSNKVTVKVVNSKPQIESSFRKHACVFEFTGASCAMCPAGYELLMMRLTKSAFRNYADCIHICAFHSEEMGKDSLAIPATEHIKGMFSGLELPSYAIDLRSSGVLNQEGMQEFETNLLSALKSYPAYCGVAVSSSLDTAADKAEIEVKVKPELTSEYRVVVLIVQDAIIGYQKDGRYGERDDYTHNHVARKVVTEYAGTFTGEKITDDGVIAAGDEASKTWTIDVDSAWDLEKTSVYALALDAEGNVNNMNICQIDGGSSDYDTK